jgi:hypothetical protein
MGDIRKEIHLTGEQHRKLEARARREDKTLATVIRDAVDAYVADDPPDVNRALAATFGVLPYLGVPARSEWDRPALRARDPD